MTVRKTVWRQNEAISKNPDMKQRHAVWVLVALFSASFFTGFHSYRTTENRVEADMNHALALTMLTQQSDVISSDTIHTFNSYLQIQALKGHATLAVNTRGRKLTPRAECSAATILALSDQRPAIGFLFLTLLWACYCWRLQRRKLPASWSYAEGKFLSAAGEPIRLTPMQHQLMEMFLQSPDHRLSKTEICDALWPKKPDASDTLYTLIRRLKPIVEEHFGMRIVSDRGRSYFLKDSQMTD